MLFIHGTSIESMEKIKENGFGEIDKIWNVSSSDFSYFRGYNPASKEKDFAEEGSLSCLLESTISSAEIAAAVQNSKADYLGIILVNIDIEKYLDNDLESFEDYSCEGMEYCYEIPNSIVNELKDEFVYIEAGDWFDLKRFFVLKKLTNNYYCNMDSELRCFLECINFDYNHKNMDIFEDYSTKTIYDIIEEIKEHFPDLKLSEYEED